MNLSERLSQYALSIDYSDLDARTISEAKRRVVDSLGCGVGALAEPPIGFARRVAVRLWSKSPSTLLGTSEKTSPDLATFVNGFMIRYFDFNDTYLSKEPAHPSDNLAACISVAESEGANGRDLLTALAVAYEVQCRLCDVADLRHRGWDHVNFGLISTALAASRLMKLGRQETSQAVNIALNSHLTMRQVRAGQLSMWKGASFANAARNGVFAAMLAREGMTGPSPVFEGEMGFFKQVSGSFKLDVDRFGGKTRPFKLPDTYLKYWPAEYHSQTAIWAALDLRKKIFRNVENVESILIETHEAGLTILGNDADKWRPTTKETADHSLPYIVALSLIEGSIDNDSYSDEKMKNEDVITLLDKTKVREDPKLTKLYPHNGMANRIRIKLRDGRSVSSEMVIPRGHPKNPMTDDEIDEKFGRLTERYLTKPEASRAIARFRDLEDCDDIGEALSLLVARR